MIFTLYYMYATLMQWWRLGALRNKLNGTLNAQNALVVGSPAVFYDPKNHRSLENLLLQNEDRIACTVVPKQKLNLSQWVNFPKDLKFFPIYLCEPSLKLKSPKIYVLVEAQLDKFVPHQSDMIQVESFGELVAWKATDNLEIVLRTDLDNLTKLVHCFATSDLDINHELRLLRIETVEVHGSPTKVRYDRKYSKEERVRYSHVPVHWKKFLNEVNRLYLKIHEVKNPKIKIDNESSQDEAKKVPVYEVKPIKKESKKALESSDSRNQLEVNDSKKSKSNKDKLKTKEKEPKSTKEKEDAKPKEHRTKTKEPTPKLKDLKREKNRTMLEADAKPEDAQPVVDECKPQAVATTNGTGGRPRVPSGSFTFKPKLARQLSHNVKPPNVLVYADSALAKTSVKEMLYTVLNREKYVVYDLPTSGASAQAWVDCTKLVVVCGSVNPTLTSALLQYLVGGGQLLCLCSDLLYSVLTSYSTAEVREHELVRFSYGEWKRVRMMHHIFCYQASPAKKQFSKDSDQSNNSSCSSSPVAPRTPSVVEMQHNGTTYTIQVQVLGAEETWQTPSLLLATVKDSQGKAIFSQVHLEIDPTQYVDDEDKFAALKDSDQARLEILKHILSSHLDMDCENSTDEPTYRPAYFLGRHELKLQMLEKCAVNAGGKLEVNGITMQFCGKDAQPGHTSESHLPVMIHACPDDFSTVKYFGNLATDEIGRLVIYADVLTSSQALLSKKLHHGLVVIPRQQTRGAGRSTNAWISPRGGAMFSVQLHVHLDTPLGRALPLAQHLVMVAVCSAVRSQKGYEAFGIGIKWPNDLYSTSGIKLGGLVAKSFATEGMAVIDVGCGINLDNANPTTCVNDLIAEFNKENGAQLKPIEYETYFALVFNELERILKIVQGGDVDYMYELYYKYWLHNDAEITVKSATGETTKATIEGIDDYGFLTVKRTDGSLGTVQPDGNTFDMLKGLIAPKNF